MVVCTFCNRKFECTEENKENGKHIGENKYKCTNCGKTDSYPLSEGNMVSFTIDEIIQNVNDLKEGKDNKYLIGKVELKVGDIKKCEQCGRVTDVVKYNGLMDYCKNFSTMCVCRKKENDKDWFEECDDDFIDKDELRKEKKDFRKRDEIIELIFDRYPPKNDGILELDRMAYMFGELYHGSINDSRAFVFDDFMRYCAENNILTK